MTHLNLKTNLDAQITNYIDYQKTTTRSKSIKISKEIARLAVIIEGIDKMPYSIQKKKVDYKIEEKQSKLNIKTIDDTDMSTKKRKAPELGKPIHDEARDSRLRAIQLASEHVDIKPIKYLVKR